MAVRIWATENGRRAARSDGCIAAPQFASRRFPIVECQFCETPRCYAAYRGGVSG
jgi:hypothetical protein